MMSKWPHGHQHRQHIVRPGLVGVRLGLIGTVLAGVLSAGGCTTGTTGYSSGLADPATNKRRSIARPAVDTGERIYETSLPTIGPDPVYVSHRDRYTYTVHTNGRSETFKRLGDTGAIYQSASRELLTYRDLWASHQFRNFEAIRIRSLGTDRSLETVAYSVIGVPTDRTHRRFRLGGGESAITFEGAASGTFQRGGTTTDVRGTVELNVNFSALRIDAGHIMLQGSGVEHRLEIGAGSFDGPGVELDLIRGEQQEGTAKGAFFGRDATEIGGTFSGGATDYAYEGVFGATRLGRPQLR